MRVSSRGRWFALLFGGASLVTGLLLFVVGNGLLARGVLAEPGLFGAPRLIEWYTVVLFAACATQWRALVSVRSA